MLGDEGKITPTKKAMVDLEALFQENMAVLLGIVPPKKNKAKVGSLRSLASSAPLPPPGLTRSVTRSITANSLVASTGTLAVTPLTQVGVLLPPLTPSRTTSMIVTPATYSFFSSRPQDKGKAYARSSSGHPMRSDSMVTAPLAHRSAGSIIISFDQLRSTPPNTQTEVRDVKVVTPDDLATKFQNMSVATHLTMAIGHMHHKVPINYL